MPDAISHPADYRADLAPAQRRQFDRLVALLGKPVRTLADYHAAGLVLRELRYALSGYGSGWAERLAAGAKAAGVPCSRSQAYRLVKLADTLTAEQAADLTARGVPWEAVMRLLFVRDDKVRASLLRRLCDPRTSEPLSCRAFQAVVRQKTPYRRPRGKADSPGPSAHPHEALRALRALVDRWPAVFAAWTEGDARGGDPALRRAERMKAARVTPAFLDELDRVAADLEALAGESKRLAGELTRLAKVLRKRSDGEAERA